MISRQEAHRAAEDVVVGLGVMLSFTFSPARAAQALGMSMEDFSAIERLQSRRDRPYHLDPEDFELIRLMGLLAEYAWEGTWFGSESQLLDLMHEAPLLEPILRGSRMIDPYGDDLIPTESLQKLRTILNAAYGRWHLGFDGNDQVTIEQIAALAGVSEKTIRMAANPKLEGHLVTQRDPHNPQQTIVLADDALAWLGRRPNFKPTRLNAGIDGQASFLDAQGLADVCHKFRERAGLSVKALRAQLKWSADEAMAYQNMEQGAFAPDAPVFDVTRLMQLAEVLQLPSADQFTRDAIRVVYHARAMAQIKQQMEAIRK